MSDFYYENGYCVFTREYLINRGYCCACGCRHCPYIENEGNTSHNYSDVPDTKRTNIVKDTHEEENDSHQT